MKVRVYQINGRRAPFAMYMGYSRMNGSIDPENYDLVFEGELKNRRTLEGVFRHFNDNKNPRPRGMHSLSVSDVVELIEPCGKTPAGFYFCDTRGFKRIDFDASLINRPDFPSCDFGKEKIVEVHAALNYFSVPRRKEE